MEDVQMFLSAQQHTEAHHIEPFMGSQGEPGSSSNWTQPVVMAEAAGSRAVDLAFSWDHQVGPWPVPLCQEMLNEHRLLGPRQIPDVVGGRVARPSVGTAAREPLYPPQRAEDSKATWSIRGAPSEPPLPAFLRRESASRSRSKLGSDLRPPATEPELMRQSQAWICSCSAWGLRAPRVPLRCRHRPRLMERRGCWVGVAVQVPPGVSSAN